jgi:hypothetical protein
MKGFFIPGDQNLLHARIRRKETDDESLYGSGRADIYRCAHCNRSAKKMAPKYRSLSPIIIIIPHSCG